jgi:glutamine synthetase
VLNTAVAEVLGEFADRLEGAKDFGEALRVLVKEEYLAHKRIVFNGNNYSPEWLGEAKKRGLLNLVSSVDAFPVLLADKNVALYEKYKVLNRCELASRVEISFDSYAKTLNIEALTFADMIRKQIIPSANEYLSSILSEIATANAAIPGLAMKSQIDLATKISGLVDCLSTKMEEFDSVLLATHDHSDSQSCALSFHDEVLPLMNEIRMVADELELMVDSEYWPIPTYGEMLYSV